VDAVTATVPNPTLLRAGELRSLEQVPDELQETVPVLVRVAAPPGQADTEVVAVAVNGVALEAQVVCDASQAAGVAVTAAWDMLPEESQAKVDDQPQVPAKFSA
jgi:hypothetical protein